MTARDLFHAALDRPAADRPAFLDAACPDPAVRRRVDALLAAHDRPDPVLDRPAAEHLPDDPLDFLLPADAPGALGRLGHYTVTGEIGRGGMGAVFKATDEKLHRVVAVKVLTPALAGSGAARRRFVREARAAAAVAHENVVAVHAVEEDGPVPYLVMAYIDGTTLQAKVEREGPLDPAAVLRIGIQVADGLAAAHRLGLVHRDVKPANILLENGVERVKLTDFGLARAADDASLTHSGVVAGTPQYMSPEQANGERVDARSDLFSLGSVLYAALAGHPPFRADTAVAVLKRVCEETPRPLPEVNPAVPPALAAVVARLMAKTPADRFQTAAEVSGRLADLLARPAEPTVPPGRDRRPAWRWAVAAGLLLAAGLGAAEAGGVTDVRGAVVRLVRPDGTLVIETDDPTVSVAVDGEDVVITGAGVKEVRLRPGQYTVRASRDGKVVSRELVSVSRNGRQVVRVTKEANPPTPAETAAERVAALPVDEQVRAVAARLKELNPGFDGRVRADTDGGRVQALVFSSDHVTDLSPLRALPDLHTLSCEGTYPRKGKLADLAPLAGLPLRHLNVDDTLVSDLTPLAGMPFAFLSVSNTVVADLAPLKGMPLTHLSCHHTRVRSLAPLAGLKLQRAYLSNIAVTDLTPLAGMPLERLGLHDVPGDRTPLHGLPLTELEIDYQPARDRAFVRSLAKLEKVNGTPATAFWKAHGE